MYKTQGLALILRIFPIVSPFYGSTPLLHHPNHGFTDPESIDRGPGRDSVCSVLRDCPRDASAHLPNNVDEPVIAGADRRHRGLEKDYQIGSPPPNEQPSFDSILERMEKLNFQVFRPALEPLTPENTHDCAPAKKH